MDNEVSKIIENDKELTRKDIKTIIMFLISTIIFISILNSIVIGSIFYNAYNYEYSVKNTNQNQNGNTNTNENGGEK